MNPYLIRQLENEYAAKRQKHKIEIEEKRTQLFANHPELAEIDNKKRNLMLKRFSMLRKGESVTDIEEQIKDYNNLFTEKLCAFGFEKDYLEIKFDCEKCKDEGYILSNNSSKFCQCFKQKLLSMLYSEASLDPSCEQTFEKSNIDIFTDSPTSEYPAATQKKYMEQLFNYALKYCNNFPHNKKRHIVLTGPTGTGKTFLLNCIGHRIIEYGFTVLAISSCTMQNILINKPFDNTDEIKRLTDVDLLIIDELGMEPMYNNITIETFFMIINERLRRNKSTLISSNLTPDQIKARYTERISSRLFDPYTTNVFRLFGTDIRTINR